jgi:ATP-dependent helicase HrpA
MSDDRIQEIKTLLPQGMLPDWVRLGVRLARVIRDRQHPGQHDAILDRLLSQAKASVELRERRRVQLPQLGYPPDLPITARKDDIVAAIRSNQVVVIAGETGSGKTTQIPKMCLEAGLGIEAKIGCTQPRRVAALSISQRIAEELNVDWGHEVGCKIRFDDRSSPETYIKLMTDGILLAETQGDPLLSEYNAIIIDEAHERSLNIDFLLGYLKGLLERRKDLKLIITSATIDTEAFSQAFNNAPILEVSGRLFPVEVVYAPLDSASEEDGEMTFIDAAVNATEQVMCDGVGGDILIFMPGERDIRETSDLIEGRFGGDADIIPLFGRLSAGDQQRVFAPSSRRKIVIATNIAETSLTIPGIRYVIDSGLARISRYNPRTRTKRLPVEPISQSSANQRKGRSGRVQDGVCIRLYSEEDFADRPRFTQPEIQRASLAEVILRMKAFRLGEIETFPFVNPPTTAAIHSGYVLLQELGALTESRELTEQGAALARLPIDPALARMLLQSQEEHATRELLIIAAGLSIQDPRERPMDQKEAAAAAHKRFLDPQSDFLTLLNIWNAYHDDWEKMRTQNQRRKFCKAHFLSYNRMQEWQDLHAQLYDALEELGTVNLNESNADYSAIHRSILTGLLGHVALKEERNTYKAGNNRQVTIFPGSSLFDRNDNPKKGGGRSGEAPRNPQATNQPLWIVAGEIVETSQIFARTVARIEPGWILQLGAHICRSTYENPHWSASSSRVLVQEKVTLYGLEVENRKVPYARINAKEATEIFIRSALVEEKMFPEKPANRREENPALLKNTEQLLATVGQERKLPPAYGFLEHNRQVRQKIETWQTRVRRHDLKNVDQALFEFYAQRIQNVSSLHELNRWLRDHTDQRALEVAEADLTGGTSLDYDAIAFPDSVSIGGQPVAVSYAYAPGEEHDGVTVKLPVGLAESVSPASVEWSVPGLREEQIGELLRALPKSIRRELMPLPSKIEEIARELQPGSQTLRHDLARFISRKYGIQVTVANWLEESLPQHLRPRIEVTNQFNKAFAAGRDLEELRTRLEKKQEMVPMGETDAWKRAVAKWEQSALTTWSFGDCPCRITVSDGELPVYAWPGLALEGDHVALRLFHSDEAARRSSVGGVKRLIESALQKDLAWVQRDLRALIRFQPLLVDFISIGELQVGAYENIKRYVLAVENLPALIEKDFQKLVEKARERLVGIVPQMIDRLGLILQVRQDVARRSGSAPASKATPRQTLSDLKHLGQKPTPRVQSPIALELEALMPARFLERVSFTQLVHLPRFLKALLIRAERSAQNPPKDQDRSRQIVPYRDALLKLEADLPKSSEARARIEEFRWMIEEFKVSLFAQELGTAVPVSPKRLDKQLEEIRRA